MAHRVRGIAAVVIAATLASGGVALAQLVPDVLDDVVEIVPRSPEPFEPDIDAEGLAIERGVWVLMVEPEHARRIAGHGFTVRELRKLKALDRVLIRVLAPQDREPAEAWLELGKLAPGAEVDFNHVYRGAAGAADQAGEAKPAVAPAPQVTGRVTIGIVDSAVMKKHEALRRASMVQRDFVPYDRPRPLAHGTAVASILVGESDQVQGALRGAKLHAASVFFEDATKSNAATASSLVQALDWLAAERVPVINMSLAGPPNAVLEAAIDAVVAKGIVVVAAVGNNGPTGEPLYPAAYPPVVGVTAVDAANRIYLYANRGPQVMFAAPGVGVRVARSGGGYVNESGTSMAAPRAAAVLARVLAGPRAAAPAQALASLRATAIDLGPAGYDTTFGHGLIAAPE